MFHGPDNSFADTKSNGKILLPPRRQGMWSGFSGDLPRGTCSIGGAKAKPLVFKATKAQPSTEDHDIVR